MFHSSSITKSSPFDRSPSRPTSWPIDSCEDEAASICSAAASELSAFYSPRCVPLPLDAASNATRGPISSPHPQGWLRFYV